jgi:antirestriction protein ArdC
MRSEKHGGRRQPSPHQNSGVAVSCVAGRRDEVLAQLDAGIAELTSSDRWAEHLRTQARFHRYSFGNCLLIHLQRPDASRVAGYRAWQALGRNVRAGERGIAILAPVVRRAATPAGEGGVDEDHVPEAIRRVATFVVAFVFDVAQTEGRPLVEVCSRLTGEDSDNAFPRLVAVAAGRGYAVEDAELPGETNGECCPRERRIRIRTGLAPAQRVKTLGHELAHALLHEEGYAVTPRPVAELEAESVAYVLCQALGIDATNYSLGYVATWAGGGDEARAALRASAQRIQRAAAELIDAVSGGREVVSGK